MKKLNYIWIEFYHFLGEFAIMACPSQPVQGTPPCSSEHCGGVQNNINNICKAQGWPVGNPVFTTEPQHPDGCYCCCSCLALGTPVAAPEGVRPIEAFQIGDQVLAAGKDLQWDSKYVEFSQGTGVGSKNTFSIFVQFGQESLIVTSDHLFLMPDKTLKRADRLSNLDSLVRQDGSTVSVSSVHIGDFYGGFHHIATSTEQPDQDLSGHLIITNGIVSADYAAQLFLRNGEEDVAGLTPDQDSLPIVGTPEHVEFYGDQPELLLGTAIKNSGVVSMLADVMPSTPAFVPASQTRIDIPDNACSFLSDDDAEAIKAAGTFRSFTDPSGQQWAEYLSTQFAAFYPNIQYLVDWADNTVNAYAYVQNGQRYVTLKGGLLRLSFIEVEGIALVLAHETAHHVGGSPTFPGGLTCEGQSDFFGANVVMRKVWFGPYYITVMNRAIPQMQAFLGGTAGGGTPCSHPPGPCRISTYQAALAAQPKPACAA